MKNTSTLINRRIFSLIPAALFLCLIHSLLYCSYLGSGKRVEQYETAFMDWWFDLRGPIPVPDDIVLVSMDEDSYKILDIPLNQPFPRSRHAQLLRRLNELGARRVVFDILFLGESASTSADQELAQAIGALPTVLGSDFGVTEDGQARKNFLLRPYTPFQEQATALGLVGFTEDSGVVRRFMVDVSPYSDDLVSLAAAAASIEEKRDRVPQTRDLINFYGPPGTIKHIPYYQVLDEDIPERTRDLLRRTFSNKLVFVGLFMKTGLGADRKDSYRTSAAPESRMFGVEIHAHAAGNLLGGNWIERSSHQKETLILALIAFFLSLLLFSVRPLSGGLLLFGSIVLWMGISFYSFTHNFFVPGAFLVTILLPCVYLVSTLYYYIVTRITQKRFQRAFELYISPEMAAQLSRNRSSLKLGGEKVFATAVFTDIAGFTNISEPLEAEEVAQMLNSYFTEVMDVIFEKQGTLIKFIGDAVFALWGAPIKIEDHAARACLSALAIKKAVQTFNASKTFAPLHTRVGIHSGLMVVGNLGSTRRFDFTAVGDSVNLAARVEGLNKYFGTTILISEAVKEQLPSDFNTLFMGKVSVAGKKLPVNVYALLDADEIGIPAESWANALKLFSEQDWDAARVQFVQLKETCAAARVAATFYIEQIEYSSTRPLPDGWHGELVFDKK